MSLQVWLPLNGNLTQQGLSNITATNNGAVISDAGKIGKCYSFNGSNARIACSSNSFSYPLSIACWVKPTNTTGGALQYVLSYSNGDGGYAGHSIGLVIETNGYFYLVANTQNIQIGSAAASNNTWYHIAITIDINKNIKAYINGNQVYSGTSTATKPASSWFTIGARSASTSGANIAALYYFSGLINDVRLYNHALSPVEVKELSKGLVLHYPLNDRYIEGTTNLYGTINDVTTGCYNGATSKYGYGTSTDIYKTTGTFNNHNALKIYMGTSGNAARPYVYFGNLFTSDGTNAPAYKTLSFDYYGTIGTYINFYKLGSGSGTGTWINYSVSPSTGTWTNSGNVPVQVNQWNHIELTLHGTTSANAEWGYGILGDQHTSNTSNYWLFANVQLETKNHATGFAGYGGTRNSNVIYDCSGYCNNGQQIGTLTYLSDTPRYSISTHFNGSSAIKNTNFPFSSNQWTVSFWYKFTTTPSAYQGFLCLSRNAGGDADKKIAAMPNLNYIWLKFESINYSLYSLKTNEWCHIVMTCDGTTGKVYENGILKYTTGSVGSILTDCDDFVVGARASSANAATTAVYLNGNMSDVRLYATALSAEDVLELYHTAARIDNLSNTWVYQYIEI